MIKTRTEKLVFGILMSVTMAIGMLVHELSVLVVIVNAMRLLRRRKFATGSLIPASSTEPRSPARVA